MLYCYKQLTNIVVYLHVTVCQKTVLRLCLFNPFMYLFEGSNIRDSHSWTTWWTRIQIHKHSTGYC